MNDRVTLIAGRFASRSRYRVHSNLSQSPPRLGMILASFRTVFTSFTPMVRSVRVPSASLHGYSLTHHSHSPAVQRPGGWWGFVRKGCTFAHKSATKPHFQPPFSGSSSELGPSVWGHWIAYWEGPLLGVPKGPPRGPPRGAPGGARPPGAPGAAPAPPPPGGPPGGPREGPSGTPKKAIFRALSTMVIY